MNHQAAKKTNRVATNQHGRKTRGSEAPTELLSQFSGSIGNHQILRQSADVIQAKLAISSPNDQYEREADRVAEMVAASSNHIDLQKFHDSQSLQKVPRRKAVSGLTQVARAPEAVREAIDSGRGRPLDNSIREFMELRFAGFDFSEVRVHTDSLAAASARKIGAQAYTSGRNIVFEAGKFTPHTLSGRRLLAHELTHVVQQNGGSGAQWVDVPLQLGISEAPDQVIQRDVKGVASAFGRGILSIPGDLLLGLERTGEGLNVFDTGRAVQIGSENARAWKLLVSLKDCLKSIDVCPLVKLVRYFIANYIETLPEPYKKQAYSKIGELKKRAGAVLAGRIVGSILVARLAKSLATRIATTAAFQALAARISMAAGTGASVVALPISGLIIQGLLQRAGKGSSRLRQTDPILYAKLRPGNLDMLWFLIEPELEKIKREIHAEFGILMP